MSSVLVFVISALWPAIPAALVVEWVRGLLRGSQGWARLDSGGEAAGGGGNRRGCEAEGQRVIRDQHRVEAGDRRGDRRDPSRRWEHASFEVQLSLVVRRIQRVDEGPSELGGDRSYRQTRLVGRVRVVR
jgi:hypothetical protein